MKKLFVMLIAFSLNAMADDIRYANVISVVPVTDNVKFVKQQCGGSAGLREQTSFIGTIVGGVVGLFAGSNVGSGSGRTAAQIGGTALGVAIGNAYDDSNRTQPVCRNIESFEPTFGGYEVVYELDGEQHVVRTQTFPKNNVIAVKMSPIPIQK